LNAATDLAKQKTWERRRTTAQVRQLTKLCCILAPERGNNGTGTLMHKSYSAYLRQYEEE